MIDREAAGDVAAEGHGIGPILVLMGKAGIERLGKGITVARW